MQPVEWKPFYEAERARLGRSALEAMLEHAPAIELGRAAIFPHTRLEITGAHVAAVVNAVRDSDEVLAIGVLHRALESEFSLDAFMALLALTKKPPRVHAFFPANLDGIEELARLAERMPVVATADPVHHGIGYGDAPDVALSGEGARDFASASIATQLDALGRHDFDAFSAECARVRSDFKRTGPVLAKVIGRATYRVRELVLVDYAAALEAPSPTWVAGALVTAH